MEPPFPLSIGDLEDIIVSQLFSQQQVPKCPPRLMGISKPRNLGPGAGANFVSFMSRVELQWHSDLQILPRSVIVKVASGPDRFRQMVQNVKGGDELIKTYEGEIKLFERFHINECNFYGLFSKNNVAPFPIPRCYAVQTIDEQHENGFLVLEDLTGESGCVNVVDGLSLEQSLSAVEKVAVLHAYSLRTDGWMNKFEFNPLDLQRKAQHMLSSLYDQMVEHYPPVTTMLSRDDFIHLSTLDQSVDYITDISGASYVPVLCHGDLWSHNFLYKTGLNKELTSEMRAIIDWQLVHPGPAGEDLAKLLVVDLDADNRRQWETPILKHYYAKLEQSLEKPPPYSFQELEKQYYRCMRISAFFANFLVPMLAEKAKATPEIMGKATLRSICAFQDTLAKADWN